MTLPRLPRGALGRHIQTGSWAILDQGFFALSNFVLNVFLARWLSESVYGAFTIAFTIFLLIATFHTALFTEPMLVLGSGKYRAKFADYLRLLLGGHWVFSLIPSLLFALTAAFFDSIGNVALAHALLGLAFACPFILFQWLIRRASYVILQPRLAAQAGMFYMTIMVASMIIMYSLESLSSASALGAIAVASHVSGVWLRRRLRLALSTDVILQGDRLFTREAMQDHWRYGRWAIGSAAMAWIPGNFVVLILPSWWGLEAAGVYRAVVNVLLPMMNITIALTAVLVPSLVRVAGQPQFRRLFLRFAGAFCVAPLIYWVIIGLEGERILHLLYAGRFEGQGTVFWLAGLIPLAAAMSSVSGAALQALLLPKAVFTAHVASTVLTLTFGVVLVRVSGVEGALASWLLGHVVTAGTALLILNRRLSKAMKRA